MARYFLSCLLACLLTGCAGIYTDFSLPLPEYGQVRVHRHPGHGPAGHRQSGIASYYADKYIGRPTANGERFTQHAMTAAHKTLPFGSRVRVTNVRNGYSVVVRINDRGPFIPGRIIDLTYLAFSRIADPRDGLADVIVTVLE